MEIFVVIQSSTYPGYTYCEWYVYEAYTDYDKAVNVADSLNKKARDSNDHTEYKVSVCKLKGLKKG